MTPAYTTVDCTAALSCQTVVDDAIAAYTLALLVNNWRLHSLTTNTGKIALTAGTSYDLKVEYQVRTQLAVAKLSWSNSKFGKTVIPQSVLRDR